MVITGITDAPIPWPIGKLGAGRTSRIVYKGLAKAVRRESELAVCHWWGVKPSTVRKWRRELGVGIVTEGTSRLFRDYSKEPWAVEALAKAQGKAHDPERCRKIAEAMTGKPRLPHVLEAMHEARRGSRHTEEARQRMSETHRKRAGRWFPVRSPGRQQRMNWCGHFRRRKWHRERDGAYKPYTLVGVGCRCWLVGEEAEAMRQSALLMDWPAAKNATANHSEQFERRSGYQ
jgi:hypothetical protein